MLDEDCEKSLNRAFEYARKYRHEYLTVEHLLLALLDNPSAHEALEACSANFKKMHQSISEFLETSPRILSKESNKDTQPTLALQRVLQRAVFQVQSVGKVFVKGENLLISIFSEQDSQAVFFLKEQKISRLDVVNYIAHGIIKPRQDELGEDYDSMNEPDESEDIPEFEGGGLSEEILREIPPTYTEPRRKKGPLDTYAEDLNAKIAKRGDIFIGRGEEIDRLIQILSRRTKNNPLLVGEPGVGKTAIVEGLAKRINDKQVPRSLIDMRIYALDLTSLVAGTRYRGDFEQRLKSILKEIQVRKDVIVFIDEIHMMISAGSASGSSGAGDMMKPMLSRGEIRCIGATTYAEFRKIFEKEGAMARRFQKIDVREPTIDETIEILKGLKPIYEKHHQVKYSLAAIRAAAELSARYMTDRFLPDKAIDILDETGSLIKLLPKDKQPTEIGALEIENIIAKVARIPAKNISLSDKEIIRNLDQNLKMLVFGQDEAINTLISTIKLARAGLRDPEKPWGNFLFAGPTGVGKTEVSQQLANLLNVELIRFDMSEYMEPHSIARLIGAPPGYVGYDQGGLLTEAIMKHPYAVVLLDEIEKAHPDLFNILLQVMDNGFLTDNNGRKADFRNTILILTTNAGAFEASRNTMGFIEQDQAPDGMEAIKRVFTPEFRNRLDAVIQFKALSYKTIDKVVDKFIAQLQGQLNEKAVILEISEAAKSWLGEKGYDSKMGARPMARAIQEYLKKPLAEEILFGALHNGGVAHVDVSKDKQSLHFRYSQKEAREEVELTSSET